MDSYSGRDINKNIGDNPGNMTWNTNGLVQRIDTTHGEPHLNQDVFGYSRGQSRKALGDNIHYREI